jgi:hypothetical protein
MYDLATGLRAHEQSRNLTADLSTELTSYANGLWTYGTQGGLRGKLLAAESSILSSFSGSYAPGFFATLEDFKNAIESYPGAAGKISMASPSPKTWTIAFRPLQARAKTRESGHTYVWQPMMFRQTRFRGARSYCAMREAARKQAETNYQLVSLKPESLGSWFLWDVGSGETRVKVAAPTRSLTASGANVFVIPVAIGAKVSPLSGPLIPPLREVVHPLVWVTGDAEVRHRVLVSDKWWANSQHVDFWAGQYVEDAGVTINNVLFWTWGGFVNFYLNGGLTMTMGKPVDGLCGSGGHSDLGDGRGWYEPSATCSSSPGLKSRSYLWDPYDGGIQHNRPSVYASDAPIAFGRPSIFNVVPVEDDGGYQPWASPIPLCWGICERWLANDDRSVVLSDKVAASLGLTVAAEVNFGPVHVGVSAATSLSVETRQLTTVRDHLSLSNGEHTMPLVYNEPNLSGNSILPQTSFVASSETFNTINIDPLTITGVFDMSISLPFGSVEVHWSKKFWSVSGVTEDEPVGASPERSRLRVGQYSDWGIDFPEEGTTGRVVMSHLPSPYDPPERFASWPWENPGGVPACLADTEPVGDPPPPPPQEDPTVPPGEMCAFGPSSPCFGDPIECPGVRDWCLAHPGWQLPPNACNPGVKAQWLSQFSGAEYDCFAAMLDYLCGGTHQQQSWGNDGSVVARVIQYPADQAAIGNIYNLCVGELVKAGEPTSAEQAQCIAEKVGQYFKIGEPCTANATLTADPP